MAKKKTKKQKYTQYSEDSFEKYFKKNNKEKSKEQLLRESYINQEGYRRPRKDDWKQLKEISQWLGWSSEEVIDIVLRHTNKPGKKIYELPYHLQKNFYDLYTSHETPKEAFEDEKMKSFFRKPGVDIKCNSVQVLKKHWTDLNKALGVQRKGNYKKPHFFE